MASRAPLDCLRHFRRSSTGGSGAALGGGQSGRGRFAEALLRGLQVTGTRQSELAAAVRVSQQVVSRWVTGKTIPEPGTVFLIEDRLGMPAGDLSRHLGYVRIDRRSEERVPRTVEAVHADPELDDLGKSILLGVYETVRRARRQAGQP